MANPIVQRFTDLPPEIATNLENIERKRRIQEALMAQTLQPDQTQMTGGRYSRAVPYSPLQGAMKLIQAAMLRKGQESLDKELTGLGQQYSEGGRDAVADVMLTAQGRPATVPQFDGMGPNAPELKPNVPQAIMEGTASDYPQAQRVAEALAITQKYGQRSGRGQYRQKVEMLVRPPGGGTPQVVYGQFDARANDPSKAYLDSQGNVIQGEIISVKDPMSEMYREMGKGYGGAVGEQYGRAAYTSPIGGFPQGAGQAPPMGSPGMQQAPQPTGAIPVSGVPTGVPSEAALAGSKQAAQTAAQQGLQTVLTPAEKAIDEAFAKDYADYVALGGSAHTEKGIQQLQGVIDQLEENVKLQKEGKKPKVNYSGEWMSARPGDWWWKREYPEAAMMEGTVQEVVQERLRPILGGQFGEKEGDRLIARAYDRTSPEKMNLKRVKRLLLATKRASQSREKAAEYFQENRTMKGYKGKVWTVDDMMSYIDGDEGSTNKDDPLGIR